MAWTDFFTFNRNATLNNAADDANWTLGDVGYSFMSPIGEGKNAMSLAQLGAGIFGAIQSQKQFERQLEEARKQFEYQKGLTGSNFQNQATNWGNQALFQTQGLSAFNADAGAQRAADLNAGFNQLNAAGNRIGVNNVVGEQQNQLQKYNKLVGV